MSDKVIDWWNIELGQEEIDSVTSAIKNRKVSQSSLTEEFEHALASSLGIKYVVCTTSGTSALMMTYMALGTGPGDVVIIPNKTAIATAHAAMILGARVELIDVKSEKSLIDEDIIESRISDRTKAIVPVHMNGRSANIVKISEIAERHGIPVVEDACQAFMSKAGNKYLGTHSRFGCFSLGLAKLVATGQGGFVACRDEADYLKIQRIRNQGILSNGIDKSYDMLAGNFKFTDIHAAIGLAQLSKVDKKMKHQREVHLKYRSGLQDIKCLKLVEVDVEEGELPLRVEVLCKETDKLIDKLKEQGINTISHAPGLNESPHIGSNGDYSNSNMLSKYLMILPCGPDQPFENIDKTLDVIRGIDKNIEPWGINGNNS